MREKIICPVCTKTKLSLHQINIGCAVYLCRDKKCTYPNGHRWIFVERTLEEMYHDVKKKTKKKAKKCKPTQSDKLNLNDLIESEISKIQNDDATNNAGDLTELFDFDELDFSGFINGADLNNESVVSKDAVVFCDNFDSSRLSDLLETSVTSENKLNNVETEFVSDNSKSDDEKLNNHFESNTGDKIMGLTDEGKINKTERNTNCTILNLNIANSGNNNLNHTYKPLKLIPTKSINGNVNKNPTNNKPNKVIILNQYVLNKPIL